MKILTSMCSISKLYNIGIILISVFLLCSCHASVTVTDKGNSSDYTTRINPGHEERFDRLDIDLPSIGVPMANYVHAVRTGDLIFTAGKGPVDEEGNLITGKVGTDLSVEEGYTAARAVAIRQLAVLKKELGSLDKVKRVVKVLGMVNCSSDFTQQPEVINGFSDLLVEVFGEAGKHARSAVGMSSLPRNIAVEIEMIVEVY